jgi:hypothetical protein
MSHLSRRRFLASSAAALSAPLLLPSVSRASALERMTAGIVGCGSRGFNLIDEFLKQSDVQLVALCDVDEFHYRDREWGKGQPYGRKAADRKGIRQTDQTRNVPRRLGD